MNKKYTINNVEVTAEQIKDIIKNNPELLEDKKINGRYFFPKDGEHYHTLQHNGLIYINDNRGQQYDKIVTELGVYKTKEDAELARDKQKAIVACWKWAEENAPFEPDWENREEYKYCVYYSFELKTIRETLVIMARHQFTLPYFKTEKDCTNFIEANKANLELLFTK